VQPYCTECQKAYAANYRSLHSDAIKTQKRDRRKLERETAPLTPQKMRRRERLAERERAAADRNHFKRSMPKPEDNTFMPVAEIPKDRRQAAGKRPQNLRGDLVLPMTPELVSLLDELLQLQHFGLTHEAVALTMLRQNCEREMLFWHDCVKPVVATLK
jgi:hypothetical protein